MCISTKSFSENRNQTIWNIYTIHSHIRVYLTSPLSITCTHSFTHTRFHDLVIIVGYQNDKSDLIKLMAIWLFILSLCEFVCICMCFEGWRMVQRVRYFRGSLMYINENRIKTKQSKISPLHKVSSSRTEVEQISCRYAYSKSKCLLRWWLL